MSDWRFTFVFHNLPITEPVGNDNIKVVPIDDPLVVNICESSEVFCKFKNSFNDQFGRTAKPSFLFIKMKGKPDIETLVSFRNILAISSISKAWAHIISYGSQYHHLIYSNYFDFYPYSITTDLKYLLAYTPSVTSWEQVEKFAGQPTPGIAKIHSTHDFYDTFLFEALLEKWNEFFISKRKSRELTSLFRSLEMAYRASAMPFGNQGTIHDYGANISLWVSAFEILIHPKNNYAGVNEVIDLLSSIYFCNKKLEHKKYRAKISKRKISLTLIQKTYYEMYISRNNFLHGNPVTKEMLFLDGNVKFPALNFCAPIIYKYALEKFLGLNKKFNLTDIADYSQYSTQRNNEDALLKIRKEMDERNAQ